MGIKSPLLSDICFHMYYSPSLHTTFYLFVHRLPISYCTLPYPTGPTWTEGLLVSFLPSPSSRRRGCQQVPSSKHSWKLKRGVPDERVLGTETMDKRGVTRMDRVPELWRVPLATWPKTRKCNPESSDSLIRKILCVGTYRN